jgi:hypothetical protein
MSILDRMSEAEMEDENIKFNPPSLLWTKLVLPNKDFLFINATSSAGLIPETLDQEGFSKEEYLEVVSSRIYISKKAKLINNLRIVLTMFRELDEDLSWIDVLALYEILIRIERDLLGITSFVEKYGKLLKSLSTFLVNVDALSPNRPSKFLKAFQLVLKGLPDSFFIQKRNLREQKSRYREVIKLITITPEGIKLKFLPPKAFIGIGYRDKGARRKPEIDGSPAWQEVAMSNLSKEEVEEINEEIQNNSD